MKSILKNLELPTFYDTSRRSLLCRGRLIQKDLRSHAKPIQARAKRDVYEAVVQYWTLTTALRERDIGRHVDERLGLGEGTYLLFEGKSRSNNNTTQST
jgi:hypothetical protein